MSFITIKKVNGKYYKYLVKSKREGKKVKRIFIKYEGKTNLGKLPPVEFKECFLCGSKENLTTDHIIPLSKGGTNELNNIQILCLKCNQKKSNKILF